MVRIEEVTTVEAPIERVFDLARSVEVHLEGNVHWGEEAIAAEGVTSGLLECGERVVWRAKHFWMRHRLMSEITAMDRPGYFQDVMIKGPFRSMGHDHYFRSISAGETEMRDVFRFEAPIPVLGRIVEIAFLHRYMAKLLRERNDALKQIAESDRWKEFL